MQYRAPTMIAPKIFETKLTFGPDDIDSLFGSDMTSNCMRMLSARYDKKCFHSTFILEITRIVRMSAPVVMEDVDASFNMSVCFEAQCLVLVPGELLVGAKIVRIEEDKIYADLEGRAKIQIDQEYATSMYRVGESYPMIVLHARYIMMKPLISVICVPFAPQHMAGSLLVFPKTYKVSVDAKPALSPSSPRQVDDLLAAIAEAKKAMSAHPEAVNFFKALMVTPEHRSSSVTATKGGSVEKVRGQKSRGAEAPASASASKLAHIDIQTDEVPVADTLLIRPRDASLDDPRMEVVAVSATKTDATAKTTTEADHVIVGSSTQIRLIILNQYLHNLQVLETLSHTYPTLAAIEKAMPVWSMYRKAAAGAQLLSKPAKH